MIAYLGIAGVAMCAIVLVVSSKARRQVRAGVETWKDAETRRSERLLLVLGLALIVGGGVVPGPLDELVGALMIGRVVRRVAKRKAAI
jgi:hypothetical protein